MNKYLSNNYSLLGKTAEKGKDFSTKVKGVIKNPIIKYLLFLVAVWLVGDWAVANRKMSLAYDLSLTFAYAIAAIGFCLLMGYSGLASLGTGGFIGIGTYAIYYVLHVSKMRLSIAIIVALLIAVAVGVIVGFISLRIEGIYLVILTLGLSEILRQIYINVLPNTISIKNFTIFSGLQVKQQHAIFITVTALVIVMIITHNLINSPTGRAMLAMKNSTAAAQAMGISLIRYRLLAFVICTMFAALSGTMLMITSRVQTASDGYSFYALMTSLNIMAAVIIGGYKSIWGALFGTFVLCGGLQNIVLVEIPFLAEHKEIIPFVSGILVILVVMFYPGGLAQLISEIKVKIKTLRKKMREDKYGKDLG